MRNRLIPGPMPAHTVPISQEETASRPPEVEKALMHLSAAAVEAESGMAVSGWASGEMPVRAWWSYRNALDAIKRAEREFKDASRG